MKRLLLIDNYDSFTYNLKQLTDSLFEGDVVVKRNDEIDLKFIEEKEYNGIIISPGPKKPMDSGISIDAVKMFYRVKPILGVCLGMQCINEAFGGKTVRSTLPLHGKTTEIHHTESKLFKNIPQKLKVARYHSLMIGCCSDDLIITAYTDDNIPMAIEHRIYPLFGVQFHPESFMTECGDIIMKNFLRYVE